MARSKWKLNFFSKNCIKYGFQKKINNSIKKIIIFNKNNIIFNFYLNSTVFIHKGLFFKKLSVSKKHLGLKFSSFSFTKKPFNFPQINKSSANCVRR